jgi:hypothetical protein
MQAQKDGGGGEVGIGFDFKDIDTPDRPDDLLAQMEAALREEAEARQAERDRKDEEYAQKVLADMRKKEQKKARKRNRASSGACGCW